MRYRAKKSGELVTTDRELGSGGQGTAYLVAGRPDLVAKVYDCPPPDLGAKLDAMIANPPPGLTDLATPASAAWPADELVAADGSGGSVGLLLPFVAGRDPVGELFNPATRPAGVNYPLLVVVLRNVARIVARFHAAGVVGGDVLNSRNLIADPATGHVAAIDCESAQVPGGGKVFEGWGWVLDYTPPRFQKPVPAGTLRSPADDLFALAVLVFQGVMEGHHPFGGVPTRGAPVPLGERIANGWWAHGPRGPYRPQKSAPPFDALPAGVRSLLSQAFTDGHADPLRRPAAQTLVDVLDDWLVAGFMPPAPAPAVGTGVVTPVLHVPEWVKRAGRWVRRHPRRTAAAVLAAGLVAGGGWWATRAPAGPEKEPRPHLGGRPTPELWKRLSAQPR